MSYVILDLEWNSTYSKRVQHFVNEIIEFGAVKLDDDLNIIDSFSVLVKPQICKRLSGRVKQLTRLTIDELKNGGVDFLTAANGFTDFLGDSILMTWGTSDIHALLENYTYFTDDYHIPFLKTYCDLQEYCEKSLGKYDEGNQMGLGACAELLGVEFSEEEQHRADADACLSVKCLRKVMGGYPIEKCILKADCEDFYKRMTFKNHFITDLSSPKVDRNQLRFRCDLCGKPAKRVKKWKLHNKNFSADFYCKNCERKFTGRVSFKQKYDGVKVNKRIIEIKENAKQE